MTETPRTTRRTRPAPPPRKAENPLGEDVDEIPFVKPSSVKDSSGGASQSTTKDVPRYVPGKYKESLETFYTTIGMAFASFGAGDTAASLLSPYEIEDHGQKVTTTGAEQCAKSMDEWAKVNPKVRGILEKLSTGGVVGAVITAHAPIVVSASRELGAFKQVGLLMNKFKKSRQAEAETSFGAAA